MQQSTGDSVKVSTPAVVLDTNAVLDWLVFRDPVMAALVRHLEAGTVRWLGCPSMRCADPDDQVFIDLALASRARWLISKDRAVLKLARRASPWGVSILQPKDWSPIG